MAPKKQALPIGAAKVIKNPKKVPRPKVAKRAHAGAPPGAGRPLIAEQPATGPVPATPYQMARMGVTNEIYPRMPKAEALSRRITKLMRHKAHESGIRYNHNKWMEVADVACVLGETFETIWYAIEADQEDRFELWMRGGIWMARATRRSTLPEVFENDNEQGPK